MKSLIVKLLLLLSLSFNISHATFLAIEESHDSCHHTTVSDFAKQQTQSDACGDLCDIHHLFHFIAIVETPIVIFDDIIMTERPFVSKTLYDTSIPQTDIKPPIA